MVTRKMERFLILEQVHYVWHTPNQDQHFRPGINFFQYQPDEKGKFHISRDLDGEVISMNFCDRSMAYMHELTWPEFFSLGKPKILIASYNLTFGPDYPQRNPNNDDLIDAFRTAPNPRR